MKAAWTAALASGITLTLLARRTPAQELPRLRAIGAVVATSDGPIGRATSIRALANGNIILNDAQSRRLVLLDSSLHAIRAILDTAGAPGTLYPRTMCGIIPFHGD